MSCTFEIADDGIDPCRFKDKSRPEDNKPSALTPMLRSFLEDEAAAITIEWVMWVPAYAAVLTIIVDASLMFTSYAGLWEAAHDTSRQLSRGEMTLSDGEFYGTQKAWVWATNPDVTAEFVDCNKVQVQVAVAASELAPFGFLGFARTFDIVATTTHFLESEATPRFLNAGGQDNGQAASDAEAAAQQAASDCESAAQQAASDAG